MVQTQQATSALLMVDQAYDGKQPEQARAHPQHRAAAPAARGFQAQMGTGALETKVPARVLL